MSVRVKFTTVVVAVALLAVAATTTATGAGRHGGQNASRFNATLSGYQEVPPISTVARATFQSSLTQGALAWTLHYEGIEGGAVQQAHIHFGQRAVNGGIVAFLCSNLPNPPPGTQACPAPPATISGTIRAADIIGPAEQGIAPGEFDELVRAMRVGRTYANIHSATYPNGEIRGQISPRG